MLLQDKVAIVYGGAGATIERRGLLDNEAVNFLNTLCGAVLAGLAAYWFV